MNIDRISEYRISIHISSVIIRVCIYHVFIYVYLSAHCFFIERLLLLLLLSLLLFVYHGIHTFRDCDRKRLHRSEGSELALLRMRWRLQLPTPLTDDGFAQRPLAASACPMPVPDGARAMMHLICSDFKLRGPVDPAHQAVYRFAFLHLYQPLHAPSNTSGIASIRYPAYARCVS